MITKELKFRKPYKEEIGVKVDNVSQEKGIELVLYIDARTAQNILNETVGPTRWQREHGSNPSFCRVSIWDDEIKQWVCKEDAGDSNDFRSSGAKAIASDAFKRACVNWGIAACLYTSPTIYVPTGSIDIQTDSANKYYSNDRLIVTDISFDDNDRITGIKIANASRGDIEIYSYNADNTQDISAPVKKPIQPAKAVSNSPENTQVPKAMVDVILNRCRQDNINPATICGLYRVGNINEISYTQYDNIMNRRWSDIVAFQRQARG